LTIRNEVIGILNCGGFNIRKWASNHEHALDRLNKEAVNLDLFHNDSSVLKPLGVVWNARSDKLLYAVNPAHGSDKITKRYILSEIAKIFDPLGLLGPVVLHAKGIMQEIWKSKISWDESVPSNLHFSWNAFASQLKLLNTLSIDRHLIINEPEDIQIHGFCDASKIGYGACLYLRSRNHNQNTIVRLICAKSRVTPIKEITIPRAELCGALMLATLYREVLPAFHFKTAKTVFWTDSTIVLQWLNKSPDTLKIFESNRVSKIQTLTDIQQWRYIPTKCNPADALSRGQLPSEFLKNRLWFDGPSWLQNHERTWPAEPERPIQNLPGLKVNTCLMSNSTVSNIFSRFSSYSKLIRVIAYCLRMSPKNHYRGEIDLTEKNCAEKRVLQLIQKTQFTREIEQISQSGGAKKCRIASLNPILDDDGLLRVGGRLERADLPFTQKHPLLLPTHNHVTDLIIRETHMANYHSGIQATLYAVRHRFWLLDGKIKSEGSYVIAPDVFDSRPTRCNIKWPIYLNRD
jgi:Pao retrotransposon peptidase.